MTNVTNNDIIKVGLDKRSNLYRQKEYRQKEVKGLGAISIDTRSKEREYENWTLSDRNVVKYLILYRSKLDVLYNVNKNIDIKEAGSAFEFNQEIIALYASLDTIIELCNFKKKQKILLKLLFEGNKIYDICNMNIGFKRSATYDLFDRMIDKIVEVNNELWKKSMKIQGYIK